MRIITFSLLFHITNFISLNSNAFEMKEFTKINKFFEQVNSNFRFNEYDIKIFNEHKINSNFISTKYKINLPYFILPAKKQTTEYVLYIGTIHGDEFAPLYFSLKYLTHQLSINKERRNKNIIYIPLLNIEGFIDGINKRRYPYRKDAHGVDLNRAFYAYDELPNFQSTPENELVIYLIEKYKPRYWVIPHSSLNILDLDGKKDDLAKNWVEDVYRATTINGGKEIPIQDFRDYSPPRSKKNWSIGKLANHLNNVYSLTFEFSGPGEYPAPNDPNRYEKIMKRKQLGRFEDTAWYAEQYYDQYLPAINTSLFVD